VLQGVMPPAATPTDWCMGARLAAAARGMGRVTAPAQRGGDVRMADYQGRTSVSAPESTLFAYLSDVSKLPEYFARMTEAHSTGGDAVHTEARMPDGNTVEGEAWFRVDEGAKRIEWGAPGGSDYHGSLDVTAVDDATSRVEVTIHSPHVDDAQVQQGVDQTLATIKEKVEGQGVGRG